MRSRELRWKVLWSVRNFPGSGNSSFRTFIFDLKVGQKYPRVWSSLVWSDVAQGEGRKRECWFGVVTFDVCRKDGQSDVSDVQ